MKAALLWKNGVIVSELFLHPDRVGRILLELMPVDRSLSVGVPIFLGMNKKLITALVALSLSASTLIQVAPMAHANTVPAIAILDTALDTSLPIFKDRIAYEVCILEWNSCPNGKNFMEGTGSSVLPANIISKNGFDHGTQMASVVVGLNPNIKIVFVRIIGNTSFGQRQVANEATVTNALNWILTNKDAYNIKSVVMAQGHNNLVPSVDYCPSTPKTKNLLISLTNVGVATFFPAGNNRDYTRLNWPACINESISVGWSDQYEGIALNGNFDKDRLDFYALGNIKVTSPGGAVINGAGSSISAQVAATIWALLKIKYPNYTQDQLISFMSQNSTQIKGSRGQFGKLIEINRIMGAVPVVDKSTLIAEAKLAISAAEAQYELEIKVAAEKLAAIKAEWARKIND